MRIFKMCDYVFKRLNNRIRRMLSTHYVRGRNTNKTMKLELLDC